MSQRFRIGNQTAISCTERMGPFEFALGHGFDAFEWFADKKQNPDGTTAGWDESDMDEATRAWIRDTGKTHGMYFTVHAPWQANPLYADGARLLIRSIDFAHDIGAELVNLHLYMDDGAAGYARSLEPVIRHAAAAGLRLSIENTPHTTPDDFNQTFACLRESGIAAPGAVGMCLDIGHANLCAMTRNNFIRYLDALTPAVPLIHLHVHENYGDADTHLTLFTGPSRDNDAGVRAFVDRLRRRDYSGALILEQWPNPPELLVEAAHRLRELLSCHAEDVSLLRVPSLPGTDAARSAEVDFTRALIGATRERQSWRGRLQWVRDRFADPAFAPTAGQLATVAIYLRLLATGELKCEEDGRHFRPNHHAEAALGIEAALDKWSTPETAWIMRRIYPYLPSWGEDFRRSEPLTRIRDIAHRNDIPADLKQDIKHRLQNKLHRCAGPEDLHTSAALLQRITAPEAGYAAGFVQEFKVFHGELQEFFNATALEGRLRALARSGDSAVAKGVSDFLASKAEVRIPGDRLLERLTALRQLLTTRMEQEGPQRRSQLRLADIGLEDYAFTLLSECVNRLESVAHPGAWAGLLRALGTALENLRLSRIEPEECSALWSEVGAWACDFRAEDRFHLLRLHATLCRARRLAESYTDRINRLFGPRVEELGRALGVAEHAIRVFSEGDIRGHVVFQLSRLVDLGLQATRQALQLPPWEAIVPGEAVGTLVRAAGLAEVEGNKGPLVLLLAQADGDAEIPHGVKGLVLGHPMPHLSHLGVRARQARMPFAACASREQLAEFERFVSTSVRLQVTPAGLSVQEAAPEASDAGGTGTPVAVPEAVLVSNAFVLPLDQARPATCGAKAAGAGRLLELAHQSAGLFQAPRGLALPFGVMERCLEAAPALQREYLAWQERLHNLHSAELEALLQRLRQLLCSVPVPADLGQAITTFFGPDVRLAVRSSANGEDLEQLAGAGLYESIVNVRAAEAPAAIAQVWASLWTRRATVSRVQAEIAHARIHMAVLLQELVKPDLSFIMHTVNPLTGNRDEALVELAAGLGEVLASSSMPGAPYRMACDRKTGTATLLACADFSVALRPSLDPGAGGITSERLDYSRLPLSADADAAPRLGGRLAQIAVFLEERLGRPQDVEGVCVGDTIHLVQARPQQGL